jgi:sterol desaturase/sphingolipid hydroxylase (fatty acid hydroxylase superfamily)
MLMYETMLRLAAFLSILGLLMLAEQIAPWRVARPLGRRRWLHNLGLLAVGSVLVRLLVPAAAMGAAFWAQGRGFGLLPALDLPLWASIVLTVVLLDLLIYFQHRIFHAVPLLWRLHRVHHADTEMDATTGLRFHPLELLLSVFIKIAAVVVLGAPPEGVLVFEVILNASSMFEHAAITLPPRLDAALRRVIITPSLHRIHHSERREETDSNFGFNLSLWDQWFGTLRREHSGALRLGIGAYGTPRDQRLDQLLLQPIRRD